MIVSGGYTTFLGHTTGLRNLAGFVHDPSPGITQFKVATVATEIALGAYAGSVGKLTRQVCRKGRRAHRNEDWSRGTFLLGAACKHPFFEEIEDESAVIGSACASVGLFGHKFLIGPATAAGGIENGIHGLP